MGHGLSGSSGRLPPVSSGADLRDPVVVKIRLLRGGSDRSEWLFRQSSPPSVVQVGSGPRSHWRLGQGTAPSVAMTMQWDGQALYLADPTDSGRVLIDGRPAERSWVRMTGHHMVHCGDVALVVEAGLSELRSRDATRIGLGAVADDEETIPGFQASREDGAGELRSDDGVPRSEVRERRSTGQRGSRPERGDQKALKAVARGSRTLLGVASTSRDVAGFPSQETGTAVGAEALAALTGARVPGKPVHRNSRGGPGMTAPERHDLAGDTGPMAAKAMSEGPMAAAPLIAPATPAQGIRTRGGRGSKGAPAPTPVAVAVAAGAAPAEGAGGHQSVEIPDLGAFAARGARPDAADRADAGPAAVASSGALAVDWDAATDADLSVPLEAGTGGPLTSHVREIQGASARGNDLDTVRPRPRRRAGGAPDAQRARGRLSWGQIAIGASFGFVIYVAALLLTDLLR